MEAEKKRDLILGIFIVSILISAFVYSIWGNLINRGTISVSAEAPFTAEIMNGEVFECTSSPCEIIQKSGDKTMFFYKDGYEHEVKIVDVKLWNTVEIEIDFKLEAIISASEQFPRPLPQSNYQLLEDPEKGIQKFVNEKTPEIAIVYFSEPLDQNEIFANDNAALITTKSGKSYRIDFTKKQRKSLDLNEEILSGIWSDSGKYFIFQAKGANALKLLDDKNQSRNLSLQIPLHQTAWTADDQLIFFTDQDSTSESFYGNYTNYVQLLEQRMNNSFSLGYYHPDEDSYSLFKTFENPPVPEEIIPASNGAIIYFRSGEKHFKILLRKI